MRKCGFGLRWLTVGIPVQALGIALKLTFGGDNQFAFAQTYFCILVGFHFLDGIVGPKN